MSSMNCWNLRVTAEVDQGGRRYMEDVTSVQFERAKGDKKIVEYAAFAVFDGHGGKEAAHFARDHMMKNIKSQKGFFSKDADDVKRAIKDGFINTHHQMWNELPNWPKTYNGHPSTAGTTASLVIIRGNKMYVANVGDSMVVMGTREHRFKDNQRAFQAMELTIDHKPELPEERKRIERCGGCVMNKAGVNRVVWNRPKISHIGPIRRSTKLDKIPFLAIARSLGDLWSFNSEKDVFVVSPIPDVYVYDLLDGREQFIVLASDGLWNMVRPYESVTIAGTFDDRKKKKEVSGTPAHELVQLALERWKMRAMRADNTSVIVVYIERRKMESANRKRDTYSESWTSARLEGSKFKADTIPFQNTDKVSEDHNKAIANENDSVAAFSRADGASTTSGINQTGDEHRSTDSEPVQDSSISSSCDESRERNITSNDILGRKSKGASNQPDQPTSSNAIESKHKDATEEESSTPTRRMTRNLSREIELSTRRSTRSSMKKEENSRPSEKKSLKRRKSAESLPSTSKGYGIGPSVHKRSKTENPTKSPGQEITHGPKTRLEQSKKAAGRSTPKSHVKSPTARKSKSEPSLAISRRSLRSQRTPVKQGK